MKRYNKTKSGYIYDKLITWIGFGFMLIIFFVAAYAQNFDFSNKLYYECIGWEDCENPFKDIECNREWLYGEDCLIKCEEDWCNLDMLPPGVYGEKKPPYFRYIPMAFFVIFILSFVANHYIHNRGKSFDLELQLPKGKTISIKELFNKVGDKIED